MGFESVSFDPITIESGQSSSLTMHIRNNDNQTHSVYADITILTGNFTVQWHGTAVTPSVTSHNTTFTLDIGQVGPGDLYGTSPLVTVHLPEGIVFAQYLVIVTLRTEEGVVDRITLFLTVT